MGLSSNPPAGAARLARLQIPVRSVAFVPLTEPMNTFPVVERELRLRARQSATYWTRCGVAAIAAMIGLQETVIPSTRLTSGTLGAATFAVVSWVGFLVACGSAFATADVISRERR